MDTNDEELDQKLKARFAALKLKKREIDDRMELAVHYGSTLLLCLVWLLVWAFILTSAVKFFYLALVG